MGKKLRTELRWQPVVDAFSAVLKSARKECGGLSQEDLAYEAGFDRTYPSLLERGLRTPTIGVVFTIAHVLDLEAVQLVQRTQDAMRLNARATFHTAPPGEVKTDIEAGIYRQLEVRAALAGMSLGDFLYRESIRLGLQGPRPRMSVAEARARVATRRYTGDISPTVVLRSVRGGKGGDV